MLPNRHSTLVVIVLLIAAVSASAQSQWLESKSTHYTVFYQAGFEKDSAIIHKNASLTKCWLTFVAEQPDVELARTTKPRMP